MIEIKSYLVGILKAFDDTYDMEKIKLEETEDGYIITFKDDVTDDHYDYSEGRIREGDWFRDNELIVKLGKPYYMPFSKEDWRHPDYKEKKD